MSEIKKYNIVWVLVDSARRYHSTGDDRSRINFMDELAESGVEFTNGMAVSAPSTVMGLAGIMTSMPSYYCSRSFKSFYFDTDFFVTLEQVLKDNGYNLYSFYLSPVMREKFYHSVVDRKYWPQDKKFDEFYENEDLNEVFDKFVAAGELKKPSYIYWHYNCRHNPKTTDIVKEFFQKADNEGYTEDNTIFILCSDHGYPDPSRGFSAEEFKKRNLTHDVVLTDDNILAPLIIKYPGCPKEKKIKNLVSCLDIVPTITDLIGIDFQDAVGDRYKIHGKSLVDLMEGRNEEEYYDRKIRIDNRFMNQAGRGTAIRGQRYKYVFYYDSEEEEFFDIENDYWEKNDLMGSDDLEIKSKIEEFRQVFKTEEKKANDFHEYYAKVSGNKKKGFLGGLARVALNRKSEYIKDPLVFFRDLKRLIKFTYKRAKKKIFRGKNENWDGLKK